MQTDGIQITKSEKIAIIGLGYVGLPLAIEVSKKHSTIGFDINQTRIEELIKGHDRTGEVEKDQLELTSCIFSSNQEELKDCTFFIVTVPTPIDEAHRPDLSAVTGATRVIAKYLNPNDLVVYESTVYPGLTEEICVPILESISGLKFNSDFFVGYSPERINPGDKIRTLTKIKKIVSASTPESLRRVTNVYGSIIDAGIYEASSIKVAEAAKVIENTQRDLNVALINELALIFHRMDIDTNEVLEAASTKWNFLPFKPGLVGGHCIGVDPYYLTHKAEQLGYYPDVILSGRRVNDAMGEFIADETVKLLAFGEKPVKRCKVGILGVTFKENCPDIRNSRVFDLINALKRYQMDLVIVDPIADVEEVKHEYGVILNSEEHLLDLDAIIVTVAHNQYKDLNVADLSKFCSEQKNLIDVKSIYEKKLFQQNGFRVWRL